MSPAHVATWTIAALATSGVIIRPWKVPEAVWACCGALLLVVTGLLPLDEAIRGVAKGGDVYVFLIGMMLLAELALREGLFAWLAAHAARAARGSATRLFALVYLVGVMVTIFLSNDATAVVLTPAVATVVKTARAKQPLPYLFICAFVANAASFVLPISNPANLVIYGQHMPTLVTWLSRYTLPSVLAIGTTYILLRITQRAALREELAMEVDVPDLSTAGRVAAAGIIGAAFALVVASAFDLQLGLPTVCAGAVATAIVLVRKRELPLGIFRAISWSVLPLVAGLFVLVAALDRTGVIRELVEIVRSQHSEIRTAWGSGILLGFISNLANNLPTGLVAGTVVQTAGTSAAVTSAVLVGVDLGPNLSVTGSLATILWLAALRREGLHVSAWQFLKLGALVMPFALVITLAALLW